MYVLVLNFIHVIYYFIRCCILNANISLYILMGNSMTASIRLWMMLSFLIQYQKVLDIIYIYIYILYMYIYIYIYIHTHIN